MTSQIIVDSLKKMYEDGRLSDSKLNQAIVIYSLTEEQINYIKGGK